MTEAMGAWPVEPDHRSVLRLFQSGEEAFVWGFDSTTREPWFLEDDQARDCRSHVKASVVCPVPGCEAPLTTVSRKGRRDGLRHLTGTGGHSRESIDHANGCAAVQDWLAVKYPDSQVRREEYSSPNGERRADVMITGRRGDRIAYEVQYSAITPQAWAERHESYRAQGILDVWLWGHRGKNFRATHEDRVELTPAQRELVAAGMPLLFVNPEQRSIAIGTASEWWLSEDETAEDVVVRTWATGTYARLEVYSLSVFGAGLKWGIESERLIVLGDDLARLRSHNAEVKALRLRRAAEKAARQAEKQQSWERHRAPQQEHIRSLFGAVDRWNRSDAHEAVVDYFGKYLNYRIAHYQAGVDGPSRLTHWQCVIYFDLIAGRAASFSIREAHNSIVARGVRMGQPDAYRLIASYLHNLANEGYLDEVYPRRRFPEFKPTTTGAWW